MFVTKTEYRKLVAEVALLKRRVAVLEKRNSENRERRKTVSELTTQQREKDYDSAQMMDEWLNGEENANE